MPNHGAPDNCLDCREKRLAYIAGVIDGEGTVSVRLNNGYMAAYVSVSNTSQELIEYLSQSFAGSTGTYNSSNEPKYYSQIYRWGINKVQDIQSFLRLVQPYLVVKRLHAELTLKFIQASLDQDELASAVLYLQIKDLNKRVRCADDSSE